MARTRRGHARDKLVPALAPAVPLLFTIKRVDLDE